MTINHQIAKLRHSLTSLQQSLADTELNMTENDVSSEEMLEIFQEYQRECHKKLKEIEEVQIYLESVNNG